MLNLQLEIDLRSFVIDLYERLSGTYDSEISIPELRSTETLRSRLLHLYTRLYHGPIEMSEKSPQIRILLCNSLVRLLPNDLPALINGIMLEGDPPAVSYRCCWFDGGSYQDKWIPAALVVAEDKNKAEPVSIGFVGNK